MAVAEQRRTEDDRPHLDVACAPSAAVELHWVTMIEPSGTLRTSQPAIADLALRRPDLAGTVGDLWGARGRGSVASASERSFPELLVLADRAGVLTSVDLDEMLTAVDLAASRSGSPPTLASETPGDRALIVERLERLRTDRGLRSAWSGLLAEVAAVIRSQWEDTGLDLSRRAARARTSQLPWTDAAGAVIGWARRDYDGLLPDLLATASVAHTPVLVVPSYWSATGLVFDLEHHLLVGIPAQIGPADSRTRTEPWVRALKALADPTRLAMLDYLGGTARSISELASVFGLAQPTASRHVRLLREAGLVTEVRRGSSVLVRADAAATGRLLDGLRATLAPPNRPPA
jgi:DNA-binding transcriptional ArsR family regulator